MFGTTEVALDGSTCGCTLSNNTILLPVTCHGRFSVELIGLANLAATTTSPAITGGLYTTVKDAFIVTDLVNGYATTNVGVTGSYRRFFARFFVDVTNGVNNEPPTIVFTWSQSGGSDWGITLFVSQVPPGFYDIAPTNPPSAVKTKEESILEKRIEHLEQGVHQLDIKELVRNEIRDIVLRKDIGDRSIDAAFAKMTDEQKQKLLEILGPK
jgi:hypothetical protein